MKKPKGFTNNPRKISEKQKIDLDNSIQNLGDLSGIVLDLNSNEYVCGNQRTSLDDIKKAKPVKKSFVVFEEPNEQGTVRQGLIKTPNGILMNYREVKWTEEQCKVANLAANKMGGTWDQDLLKFGFEAQDLMDSGFDDFEVNIIFPEEEPSRANLKHF